MSLPVPAGDMAIGDSLDSVANDVVMGIADLVVGCERRRREPRGKSNALVTVYIVLLANKSLKSEYAEWALTVCC